MLDQAVGDIVRWCIAKLAAQCLNAQLSRHRGCQIGCDNFLQAHVFHPFSFNIVSEDSGTLASKKEVNETRVGEGDTGVVADSTLWVG